MISVVTVAIQKPINYVMRLKAGGTWVLACQWNDNDRPKLLCKSISVHNWGGVWVFIAETESEWRGEERKKWKKWNLTCLVVVVVVVVPSRFST